MSVNWATVQKVISNPEFQKGAASVAGAGITAYAGMKQNSSNQRQSASEFAATMAQRQRESSSGQRLSAATSAAAAAPLGANENYTARNAMLSSILPGLRNVSISSADPAVRAATPTITGGLRLPEGGIPASAFAALGPRATASAIANRQKHITNIDPTAPGIDLASMGFDADAMAGLDEGMGGYQASALSEQQQAESDQQSQLHDALQQNYSAGGPKPPVKKKRSLLAKLGSVAKIAVPLILAATGVGIPAAAAITAATHAASKKADGGSWGDALKSGVVGGATGAVGAGAIGGATGAGMSKVSQAGLGLTQATTRNATVAALQKAGTQVAQNGASAWVKNRSQATAAPQQPGVNPDILAAALRRQRFGG